MFKSSGSAQAAASAAVQKARALQSLKSFRCHVMYFDAGDGAPLRQGSCSGRNWHSTATGYRRNHVRGGDGDDDGGDGGCCDDGNGIYLAVRSNAAPIDALRMWSAMAQDAEQGWR